MTLDGSRRGGGVAVLPPFRRGNRSTEQPSDSLEAPRLTRKQRRDRSPSPDVLVASGRIVPVCQKGSVPPLSGSRPSRRDRPDDDSAQRDAMRLRPSSVCALTHAVIRQAPDGNYVPTPVPRAGEEARGGLEGPRPARLLQPPGAEGGAGGSASSVFTSPKHGPSFLHSFMCCVTLSRSLALSVLVRTCKGGADQDARLTGLTPAQRRG